MAEQIFVYLSVIIGVVLVSMAVMKIFKQPIIIGYIIAGTIISLCVPKVLNQNHAIETFSSIGISFLLFIVGLELNLKIIKDIGKTSILAGSIQVFLTTLVGFGIGKLLGFENLTALYLSVGFAFSSTIVILKILSDKGQIESVYGRLSMGILIVQDLIVISLLITVATIEQMQGGGSYGVISLLIAKLIALAGGLFVVGKYILPIVTRKIAESQEYLFLFSIGRCLILGSIFHLMGFGIETGALIAGMMLASSEYKFEIISKVKPLRDFFIVMFFVLLGSRIQFPIPASYILPVIVFTVFILIIKPIIVMFIVGRTGHTKKNNFLSSTTLGQISEFSFILIMMGISLGHIHDKDIISMVTIIGLITIAVSSYFMLFGQEMFNIIKKHKWLMHIIPGKIKEHVQLEGESYEIILFGYGRFGSQIYEALTHKSKKEILVVDENPKITQNLQKQGIPCIYGDAGEMDFLDELNISKTRMVISTMKNYDDSILLLKTIKRRNEKIITILVSHNTDESIKLYTEGADYIILPHYIGANHASLLLEEFGFDIGKFMQEKQKQLEEIKSSQKNSIFEILKAKN